MAQKGWMSDPVLWNRKNQRVEDPDPMSLDRIQEPTALNSRCEKRDIYAS